MRLLFPRKFCLKTKLQFKKILKLGEKISVEGVVFYCGYNSVSHPRFGIVISKKIVRKAVNRNKIKRLFREIFRLSQNRFANRDILLYVNKVNILHKKTRILLEQFVKEAL